MSSTSSTRGTNNTINHDENPFKSWKSLFIPTNIKFKPTITDHVFPIFLIKSTLAVSTVASISLILFFAFSNQSVCLPQYDTVLGNFSTSTRRTTTGDDHEKTNISHILFGIGGSGKTWNDRRHFSELWWKPNVTRGFVWLDEKPPQPERVLSSSSSSSFLPYRISANTSGFKYSCSYGSRSAVRMARILKESFELGLENVRWFVMGDDDTVFFTENLVVVLGKYDHNQMYYVGGNSESVEQDVIHSYTMAYGGGGFAISYALAAELVRVLDGCIDRYHKFFGSDQKVQACLSEIGVPITRELGFHQLDIRGDPYGVLAAHPVAPLVSLHHLDYLQPLFPNLTRIDSLKKLVGAYESDPGRTLQQTLCYDLWRNWSVSVSWGYTVQLYPSLVTAKVLGTAWLTFKTWRTRKVGPFTFNTRTVSPDPCEKPGLYFLDGIVRTGAGRTVTTYKRHVKYSENVCDRVDYTPALAIESIKVSAPQFTPDWWNKAPRRQCCEIINDGTQGALGSVVKLQIRGCNRFESVTPP